MPEHELPKYVKDKFNIVMSRDENGKVMFTTLSNVIPMADLWEVRGDPLQLLVSSLGPLPKYVMENATNRNTFTRQDIKKIDQEFDLLLPGVADWKVPVWSTHLLRTAVGRPLNVAESVGEVVTGQINPKTGEPMTWKDKPNISTFITGISIKQSDIMANLMDAVSDMESERNKIMSAAARWGKKGYPARERELLQRAHAIEEKLNTGKFLKGRQELRKKQYRNRVETQQRRAGLPR